MQKYKKSPVKKGPVDYYGYSFHEDGSIYNPFGKKLVPNIDKYGNRSILLCIPDSEGKIKSHRVYIARAMYNLYHDTKLPNDMVVGYLDGDKGNYGINNLIATKKPGFFQKRVLSKKQVLEIQTLYSNLDNHFHSQWKKREGDYSIRDLAKKYNVSAYTIQRAIDGTYKYDEIEDGEISES